MGLSFAPAPRPSRRGRSAETHSGGSVQVWGENVYYEAAGVAEAGPTILFLHESGGSGATWHGQLTGLAQSARCLVVDLPGHGRSEGTGCSSVGGYRDAVLGFLDALAIRWPVVLAGACLGASVAVDVALHSSVRVAGLVLAGVSEGGRASEGMRTRTAMGEAPSAFVEGLFSEHVSHRLLKDRLQQWRLTSPLVRRGDLTADAEYAMAASLRQISHPMLVVTGAADPIASPEGAVSLVAGLPNARVATVPAAGCLSMMEQPLAFNQAVGRFLADLCPECPIGPEDRQTHGGYRRF